MLVALLLSFFVVTVATLVTVEVNVGIDAKFVGVVEVVVEVAAKVTSEVGIENTVAAKNTVSAPIIFLFSVPSPLSWGHADDNCILDGLILSSCHHVAVMGTRMRSRVTYMVSDLSFASLTLCTCPRAGSHGDDVAAPR